ncbi:MAG: hypothetical protein M1825_001491 [Sarcosagium campestre]|nr:MAG: hypothetical protein M1825_001491 [Sarcosagium campestre]
MDFWARLIGGVGASPGSRQSANITDPQQRLTRFKRLCGHISQARRSSKPISLDPAAVENFRLSVQRLNATLYEESHSPASNACLTYALSSRIYKNIANQAIACHDDAAIREAVVTFGTLVDGEEDEFLNDGDFAQTLMGFVGKVAGINAMIIGADTEAEIVELLFGIAAKIRLQPEILPIWFTPKESSRKAILEDKDGEEDLAGGRRSFEGVTNRDDFPLFYLLIDYVHHEARVGDFARTGLLYIIESASHSTELERWIVDSDLATLMASGLGALYSQLSRKLVTAYEALELPPVLALSDYSADTTPVEAENSISTAFQAHIDTFLSYLVFWQDVLEHCKSIEVKQTLLDHFQILFLQQLLYPSLLESSDVDGGSSVAVLTYLRRILESLDHPELIHLILYYLLALPEPDNLPVRSPQSPFAAKRRRTLEVLSQSMLGEDKPNPALFNLADLIVTSLRSKNPQTVTATLKLVTVLLKKHHRYAISTMLRTMTAPSARPERTIGAVNKEVDFLLAMVTRLGDEEEIDEAYGDHLRDVQILLETHPCSTPLLASGTGIPVVSSSKTAANARSPDVCPHSLRLDDPLLRNLLGVLDSFLTNPVEINLSLTEALTDLASCGYMRLDGWFAVDPAKYVFDGASDGQELDKTLEEETLALVSGHKNEEDAAEQAQMLASIRARRTPSWLAEDTPPLLAVLQSVMMQLRGFQAEIPDFHHHLAGRKQAFRVSEELNEALETTPMPAKQQQQQHQQQQQRLQHQSPAATPSTPTSTPLQAARVTKLGSMSPALFAAADRTPNSASRSTSPRGRQPMPISTPTRAPPRLQDMTPSLFSSSSPTTSEGSRRGFSPSPLRDSDSPGIRSSSPSLAAPVFASSDSRELRRRVGARRDAPRSHLASVVQGQHAAENTPPPSSGASSVSSESPARRSLDGRPNADATVTVSHLLTNVVILQEFILELAAVLQLRASIFDDVRFV